MDFGCGWKFSSVTNLVHLSLRSPDYIEYLCLLEILVDFTAHLLAMRDETKVNDGPTWHWSSTQSNYHVRQQVNWFWSTSLKVDSTLKLKTLFKWLQSHHYIPSKNHLFCQIWNLTSTLRSYTLQYILQPKARPSFTPHFPIRAQSNLSVQKLGNIISPHCLEWRLIPRSAKTLGTDLLQCWLFSWLCVRCYQRTSVRDLKPSDPILAILWTILWFVSNW